MGSISPLYHIKLSYNLLNMTQKQYVFELLVSISWVAVISADQRDAAEYHEQGEKWRVVHRGCSEAGQEGPESAGGKNFLN